MEQAAERARQAAIAFRDDLIRKGVIKEELVEADDKPSAQVGDIAQSGAPREAEDACEEVESEDTCEEDDSEEEGIQCVDSDA